MRRVLYLLVKSTSYALMAMLALILIGGGLSISAMAKNADKIDAEQILKERFGIRPEGVKELKGGGESWVKKDLWISFIAEGPAKPLDQDGLKPCADMRRPFGYFLEKYPGLPLVGEWLCFEKVNEKDPASAGVVWMWLKEKQLNLYHEWK
ncbi:hypothetical protein GC177_08535 [bacterium]|nr:hypothetical protein [bacterium]